MSEQLHALIYPVVPSQCNARVHKGMYLTVHLAWTRCLRP